jgi:hypothetical protein
MPVPVGAGAAEPHRAVVAGVPAAEAYCFAWGVSWVEATTAIIRDAVRAYLAKPHIHFPGTATA